ncbi:IS66 family transposase [Lactiplantibacillus argentoratensis]|uniref:IS66 family transposase n=1 Tax=Lactiplantibacillus argentoratensis TaxID=271881 RepID=UPI003B2817A8
MTQTTEDLLAQALKEIQLLKEQVAFLNRKLYGVRSEKMTDPNQLSLLEDPSVFTEPEQTGRQSEEEVVASPRKPKRKRSEGIAADLPVEETLITREASVCEHGHQLVAVGKHFVRTEIEHVPGRLYQNQIFEQTYKCVACEEADGDSHLYQAEAPRALFPHSMATPSLVAEVLHQKYTMASPLFRQLHEWARAGVLISETTLANWVIGAARLVQPVYDLLGRVLSVQPFLQGDETPFQVLREPGKTAQSKSYIWVKRSIKMAPQQVVFYAYGDTRSGKFAKSLYTNFSGVLQCDGYAGYNALTEIDRAGCWAHVRRKFFDDAKKSGTLHETVPLKLLNQMFALEKSWTSLDAKVRRQQRDAHLRPVIDEFWSWCDAADIPLKSTLGKAVTYAQNQRRSLNRVLEYGELELSNNAAERAMKTFVIGRKNWLFATSPAGADANAIWMTLIETAKANGLDPRAYIRLLLEQLSQLPEFPTEEQLEACLPWNQTFTGTAQSTVA